MIAVSEGFWEITIQGGAFFGVYRFLATTGFVSSNSFLLINTMFWSAARIMSFQWGICRSHAQPPLEKACLLAHSEPEWSICLKNCFQHLISLIGSFTLNFYPGRHTLSQKTHQRQLKANKGHNHWKFDFSSIIKITTLLYCNWVDWAGSVGKCPPNFNYTKVE